jgi:hypothetical protein
MVAGGWGVVRLVAGIDLGDCVMVEERTIVLDDGGLVVVRPIVVGVEDPSCPAAVVGEVVVDCSLAVEGVGGNSAVVLLDSLADSPAEAAACCRRSRCPF